MGRPIRSTCGFALEGAAHLVPAAGGAALISGWWGCFRNAHVRLANLTNGPGTPARSCAEISFVALYYSLVGEQRQTAHCAEERSFPAQDDRAAHAARVTASSSLKGTGCRTRSRIRNRACPRLAPRSHSRRKPGSSESVAAGHGGGAGGSGSCMHGAAA